MQKLNRNAPKASDKEIPVKEDRSRFIKTGAYLALILLGGMSINTFAQLPTATVLGSVTDSNNGLVVGAVITVSNDRGRSRTVKTGNDGSYRFPALEVGNYTEQIAAPGFKTEKRRLVLNVGDEAVENVSLQVGSESRRLW